MVKGREAPRNSPALHQEYGTAIAGFAVLIGAGMVLSWLTSGTGLHQLAIGLLLSSVTLAIGWLPLKPAGI
jgi:hypothetical protein